MIQKDHKKGYKNRHPILTVPDLVPKQVYPCSSSLNFMMQLIHVFPIATSML